MELGFDVTTFKTAYGVINFVEDPALQFMTKFHLPYGITGGTSVMPKKIAFAINPKSCRLKTLRPDVLNGNLMLPGEDVALKEDIIGEHSFEMESPRDNALIIFD